MAENHVFSTLEEVKQTIKNYCRRTCTSFVVLTSTKGFGETGSPAPYSVLSMTKSI